MDYIKHYDALIDRARNRPSLDGYFETHHVIPICLGGKDDKENLVKLTAREHYIAHYLLAKAYLGTRDGYKLVSAFRFMSVDSHGGNRVGNKDYDRMRKMFSKNHPTKNSEVREKISNTVKKRWAEGKYDHIKIKRETRVCGCGCGKHFFVIKTSKQKYIKLHQRTVNGDQNKRNRHSNTVKNNLKLLSKEEMSERMKNSFGNCDHVARGKSISSSKRGVKTNQLRIMILRVGQMSEEDFFAYLSSISPKRKNMFIKLRERYFDGDVPEEIEKQPSRL